MAYNAKYNELINQRENVRSQYTACSNRIANCNSSIRRLKTAKQNVANQKSAFATIRSKEKNIPDSDYEWRGTTKVSFKTNMATLDEENDYYYKYTLDKVLDALNDEITRLENKRMKEYGNLGTLGSWINSLSNEIENFFN